LPGYSWWDVPVAEESQSAEVQAARRGYQKARRARRFYY
jgi:TPP-dependent trihydroxycyclohexane-1,2-dione (THcHDO) dehydratase